MKELKKTEEEKLMRFLFVLLCVTSIGFALSVMLLIYAAFHPYVNF